MQIWETALCALVTIFFGAWSGLLTLVIGVLVNTDGLIGLLPIIATLELTGFNHYAREIRMIKTGLILNVLLWAVYAFCIGNYVGVIGETAALALGVVSYFRMERAAAYS